MNTKSTMNALTILGAVMIWHSSHGQVMIEGGTNGARKSNRDGKTEVPASYGYSESIVSGRTFAIVDDRGIATTSPVRGITTPTTTFRSTSTPVVRREDPDFRPVTHVIDINQIHRINKLERELGVIKTTKTAWIALDWNLLFSGNGTGVRPSSKHILDKVIAYLANTRGKSVSVTYDFLPGSDNADIGVERSISVVNYMSQKSGMSIGNFCVCQPETVKTPVAQNNYSSRPRPPARSVVNIRIQR